MKRFVHLSTPPPTDILPFSLYLAYNSHHVLESSSLLLTHYVVIYKQIEINKSDYYRSILYPPCLIHIKLFAPFMKLNSFLSSTVYPIVAKREDG